MNFSVTKYLFTILVFIFLTACSAQGNDWVGTYRAVLPCANCEGVETVLTLNADTTYVLKIKFLGAAVAPTESTGKFEWTSETAFTLDKEELLSADYIFVEGKLHQRGLDGNMVQGPDAHKFIFTKQ